MLNSLPKLSILTLPRSSAYAKCTLFRDSYRIDFEFHSKWGFFLSRKYGDVNYSNKQLPDQLLQLILNTKESNKGSLLQELVTINDILRYSISIFNNPKYGNHLSYGHSSIDSLEDVSLLVLTALNLPIGKGLSYDQTLNRWGSCRYILFCLFSNMY